MAPQISEVASLRGAVELFEFFFHVARFKQIIRGRRTKHTNDFYGSFHCRWIK